MIGQTILHYKILAKLGEGGMGVVYKAEDTKLKREVALKFLPTNALQGKEEKERFTREAQAAAALNHANIAHIYAIEEFDGQMFIAMEYIEGRSLQEIVETQNLVSLQDAINYATQIAAGLQAAHEKGVIHRDIKSANIMVTDKGVVKIMDFGLAKLANRSKMTIQGSTLGTAAYMSPEQARGEELDKRSDIWSLGVVLYEMIAGRLPFKGDYEQAVIYSILNEEPEPLTALRSGLPIALDGIIAKTLAKEPDIRYQHVDELPADLKTLETASMSRSRISAIAKPSERFKPSEGLKLPWVIAAVLGVALVVALILLLTAKSPDTALPLTASLNFEEDNAPGQNSYFALSPDGQQLAYTPSSNLELRIRNLADGSTRSLSGTEGAERPFWSTDGSMLGYFAAEELRVVPAKGGPPIALAPAPRPLGGTWNDKGVILYNPAEGPLFQIPAAGGTPTQVTQPRYQGDAHRGPAFLPDGRHFLFFTWYDSDAEGKNQIYKGDLETGEFEHIRDGSDVTYVESGFLVFRIGTDWTVASLFAQRFDPGSGSLSGQPLPVLSNYRTPGGYGQLSVTSRTIVFVPSRQSQTTLPVLMKRSGEVVDSLQHRESGWKIKFSHDGKRVAFVAKELWVHDLARKISERVPTEVPFPYPYAWSSDDASIVYSTFRVSGQLRKVSVAGTAPKETIFQSAAGEIWSIDCSPDGHTALIVYAADENRKYHELWACDLKAGTASRVLKGAFNVFESRFAPNGKWYAYASDEGRETEVYLRPSPGPGAAIRVSAEGGFGPRWRQDGKELFYLNGKKQLVAVKVDFAGQRPTVSPPTIVLADPKYRLRDVHPDGQRFLVQRDEEIDSGSQLTILRNWQDLLEERE